MHQETPELRILWLAPRQVWPTRGGGQVRTAGLIASTLAAGHQVLLAEPGSARCFERPVGVQVLDLSQRAGASGYAAKLVSQIPLRSPRVTGRSLNSARTAIQVFQPEIAVVSEVHSAGLANALLPPIPWVYDAHNVEHELYAAMRTGASSAADRLTFAVDYRRVAAAERRLLANASAVFSVSEEDAESLRAIAPGARVEVLPSSVPTPVETAEPAFADAEVLFVGSLDYPPNTKALEELVGQVMPVVLASREDARLTVVGRRPPHRLRNLLHRYDWCSLREDVSDLAPEYRRTRCVVLPIRSGSGSRLKVYEALSYGLPLVATPAAIAGVPVAHDVDVVVVEGVEQLATACVQVLSDDAYAARLGHAARETFLARLAWDVVGARTGELLADVAAASA